MDLVYHKIAKIMNKHPSVYFSVTNNNIHLNGIIDKDKGQVLSLPFLIKKKEKCV